MKTKRTFLVISLILIVTVFLVNIPVHTRQGINYKVTYIKIPLYLKVLDFFDRHYNYKALVSRITSSIVGKEEKVFALFAWCYNHIRPQPENLPIIDDHVWHIIIRGYGAGEQSTDVFTTLCNYAGFDSFYLWIQNQQLNKKIPFSFVSLNNKWFVFDVAHGVYFKNRQGGLASIGDIMGNDWIVHAYDSPESLDVNYGDYFRDFPEIIQSGLRRANIQSPLKRFIFEVKRCLRRK